MFFPFRQLLCNFLFQVLEELKQIVNESDPSDRYELLEKIGVG